ncbi:hypothetical protein O3Q49_12860 [Enterococcus lactis]
MDETKGLEKYSQIYLEGWTTLDGMQAADLLLKKHAKDKLPTAIMVGNDPIAVGVYRSLQKMVYIFQKIFRL